MPASENQIKMTKKSTIVEYCPFPLVSRGLFVFQIKDETPCDEGSLVAGPEERLRVPGKKPKVSNAAAVHAFLRSAI